MSEGDQIILWVSFAWLVLAFVWIFPAEGAGPDDQDEG